MRLRRTVRSLGFCLVSLLGAVTAPHVGVAAEADPWAERRVLNVAHAGGDLEAPHSTLFAMKTAVRAGTDVLEMDVRLSADGVLMVHHDDTVDRTTEANGPMRDRTAAELQTLDNAYWFVPNCWRCQDQPAEAYTMRGIRTGDRAAPEGFGPDDFTIPTLEQVATSFPTRLLDVEIKDGPDGLDAAKALADFIDTHGRRDRFLVASFDDEILAHFKAIAPDIATSPGLDETVQWFATRDAMPHHRVLQVPPVFSGIEVVTQQFVDDAHADGLAVWVWFNGTEDDAPDEWRRLLSLGVDALLTGKPRAAQATILAAGTQFRATPEVQAVLATRRRATVDVACPVAHVNRCRISLVAVAVDRGGIAYLVGLRTLGVDRGETRTFRLRWPEGPRASELVVLALAANDDTASTFAWAMPAPPT